MNAADSANWARVWKQVGNGATAAQVYQELVSHYAEPHRHYHTLAHISDLLGELDEVQTLATQIPSLELAIWFHDVIYDTHGADNEEKSAELARRRIVETGGESGLADAVSRLIMATKTHDPGADLDARLLVDLDLGIFGKSAERFDQYESQIRQEYDWVPELGFKAKRAEILERFLARPRIYWTAQFSTTYEPRARANLKRSIQTLRGR